MKTFEVEIYVGDMLFPHVATLEIEAKNAKGAREWVLSHISVSAEKVKKQNDPDICKACQYHITRCKCVEFVK